MLTITDFIKILQKYYKQRGVSSPLFISVVFGNSCTCILAEINMVLWFWLWFDAVGLLRGRASRPLQHPCLSERQPADTGSCEKWPLEQFVCSCVTSGRIAAVREFIKRLSEQSIEHNNKI